MPQDFTYMGNLTNKTQTPRYRGQIAVARGERAGGWGTKWAKGDKKYKLPVIK